MPSDLVGACKQFHSLQGFTSCERKEETEGRVKQAQNWDQLGMPVAEAEH